MKPFVFLYFAIVLSIVACNDEEVGFPVLLLNKIELSEGDVVARGAYQNIDPNDVVEYGILWSEEQTPEFNNSFKISFDKDNFTGDLAVSLTTIKPSTNYFVRIYCKVSSNTFYSAIQEYSSPSLGALSNGPSRPIIEEIIPSAFNFKDTIQIIGSSFGMDSSANKVFFNQDSATIISRSDTSIFIRVPVFQSSNAYFITNQLQVFVDKYQLRSVGFNQIELLPPHIRYRSQTDSIYSSGQIVLKGYGFHPTKTTAYFGQTKLRLDFIDEESIYVYAPPLFESITDEIILNVGSAKSKIGTYKILAPIIENDFSNEEIGSLAPYSLNGKYLDGGLSVAINNNFIYIEKEFDKIEFIVPTICEDKIEIKLFLDGEEKVLATVDRADPRIFDFQVEENSYYDAKLKFKLQYLPRNNWKAAVNGIEGKWDFINHVDGIDHVEVVIPRNVTTENGWLDLDIYFCDNQSISKDSILFIPPPVLSPNNKINSFYFTTLEGNYLGGQNKVILIDDEVVANYEDNFYLAKDPFFKVPYIENGTHNLQVIINGRPSNTVSIDVVNPWEKIGSLSDLVPEINTHNKKYPIAFLNNEILYVGSPVINDRAFFKMDLNTFNIEQLQDLPLESGVSISTDTAGFVFYQAQLSKYDYQNDSWMFFPELPYSLLYPNFSRPEQWEISGHSGFIEKNKFFFISGCMYYPYFYYDFLESKWIKLENGPSVNYCSLTFTFDQGDIPYITNYRLICEYDPASLNYSSVISRGLYTDILGRNNSSRRGFYYNGELYLYTDDYFETLNVSDFTFRKIGGPDGTLTNILRGGNYAYAIIGSDIWRYNLLGQ